MTDFDDREKERLVEEASLLRHQEIVKVLQEINIGIKALNNRFDGVIRVKPTVA